MIIYSLISNNSGMLRVVDSLGEILNLLPPNFPLKLFIFSRKRPSFSEHPKCHWFEIEEFKGTEFTAGMAGHLPKIQDILKDEKVDWIIGDCITLQSFSAINAKICYDVHQLARPFFRAMNQHLNLDLDTIIKCKKFIRHELKFMQMAQKFIVNSKGSEKALIDLYPDISVNKTIDYLPLNISFQQSNITAPAGQGLYYFGRIHVQKGLHYLFQHDWNELPLTIRGFQEDELSSSELALLKKSGITPLLWTVDSEILKKDIMSHELILFPSIYEPWGLALQEALALGKICVANKCNSGHEEQIIHNQNGFLLDFSTPDLKIKIKEILELSNEKKLEIRRNAIKMSASPQLNRAKYLKDFLIQLQANTI